MTLEKLYNKDALLPEDTIIIDHHLSTINPHQIPITKVNLVIDYINAELLYNLVDEKTTKSLESLLVQLMNQQRKT